MNRTLEKNWRDYYLHLGFCFRRLARRGALEKSGLEWVVKHMWLGCAMDYLWHELGTGIFDSRHLQEELSRCLVFGDTAGEGSAACVAYAIRTRLTSDSRYAVWAARSAYEDL